MRINPKVVEAIGAGIAAVMRVLEESKPAPTHVQDAASAGRVDELEEVVNDGLKALHQRMDDFERQLGIGAVAPPLKVSSAPPPPEPPKIPEGDLSVWDKIDREDREAGGKPPPPVVMTAPGVFGDPSKPATDEQAKEWAQGQSVGR